VGVFNIGIEGGPDWGRFPRHRGRVCARAARLPAHAALFAVAIVFSGLWALVAAVLRNKLHISEVILTIMLNYIALYLVGYLVNYPFKSDNQAVRTDAVLETARLRTLVPNSRLNTGLFLALGPRC
jgi:simple sugar transport system permease protein